MVVKASRTVVQAKLTDLTIEDLTENTLYSKVILETVETKYFWLLSKSMNHHLVGISYFKVW